MAQYQTNFRGDLTTDPIRNFRFKVTFLRYDENGKPMSTNGFGFTQVTGLSIATEAIPYREGGYNSSVHQLPGQTTFSPITLQRGVHLGNDSAWNWMRLLYAVNAGGGVLPSPTQNFRTSMQIDVLQHPVKLVSEPLSKFAETQFAGDDPVAISFKVYNAWITSLAYSDLQAGDNALIVEQMTIVHEGFDMWWQDVVKGTRTPGTATPKFFV